MIFRIIEKTNNYKDKRKKGFNGNKFVRKKSINSIIFAIFTIFSEAQIQNLRLTVEPRILKLLR